MNLTAKKLREILDYDPLTGKFSRLSAPKKDIGRIHKIRGYHEIYVEGRLRYAHRLAWLYMTGEWPKGLIDHIDHDKSNNRWNNLREANFVSNGQNRKEAQINNELGILGVSKNGKKYRARIKIGNKQVHLGTFETIDDAKHAYDVMKNMHHI